MWLYTVHVYFIRKILLFWAEVNSHNFAFDFQIRLRFWPKLRQHVRPKVRLRPYKCLWFRPQFQLRPKLAKSVSVGL